jgi:hypothetical protein
MTEDEIQSLVAHAHGQMLVKKSSTDLAVRWVLRIASLKKQPLWQVWALLQLSDTSDLKHPQYKLTMERVQQVLDDYFPPAAGVHGRETMTERAIKMVSQSRTVKNGTIWYASPRQTELDHGDARRRYKETGDEAWRTRANDCRFVLDAIKTQVQFYLISLENKEPDRRDESEP